MELKIIKNIIVNHCYDCPFLDKIDIRYGIDGKKWKCKKTDSEIFSWDKKDLENYPEDTKTLAIITSLKIWSGILMIPIPENCSLKEKEIVIN